MPDNGAQETECISHLLAEPQVEQKRQGNGRKVSKLDVPGALQSFSGKQMMELWGIACMVITSMC